MSNEQLIIEERARDIGDFLVGRLLPFRKKRMVGPFIFIDHMGPSEIGPGRYMEVDQHPHIGLSTLTYLFEGSIEHQDSIGTKQLITPGSVNWMTAGKGVTHTERTPQDFKESGEKGVSHGYQIWVALPKEKENMEPEFQHIPHSELPKWKESGAELLLVAGEAFGRKSPLNTHSPLVMVDLRSEDTFDLDIGNELKGEIGIIVVKGSVLACDQSISAGQLLVSKSEDACRLWVNEDAHLLLFGGEPFPEQRFIDWNFVSSSKETLAKARQDWKNKDFPHVEGDSTYIPHPGDK